MKKLRCSANGCRTLTSHGLCGKHTEKSKAAITLPDNKMQERIAKIVEREKNAQHLDNLRADLNSMRDGAEKIMKHNEQPVFYEGENHGFR